MKNYLVKGLHRIGSTKWWPGRDRADEGNLFYYYSEMAKLSEASFMHFLQDDWELVRLESTATDVNHVFRQQFRAIWDLWNSEPCNIYYCGADVQLLRPTTVFGRYQHFMMFNYTDPKTVGDIPHFLNADVRYFPAEMDKDMFADALVKMESMNEWNGDQILYNRMVWGQGLSPEQVIDPTMAYQGPWIMGTNPEATAFADQWNGCRLEEASVVHWHGSRNAACKLEVMSVVNRELGVPNVPVRSIPIRTIDCSNMP